MKETRLAGPVKACVKSSTGAPRVRGGAADRLCDMEVELVDDELLSKMRMRAVKVLARGTSDEGGQRTDPTERCSSEEAEGGVRYKVALDPAAAQGTTSSSTSIAEGTN